MRTDPAVATPFNKQEPIPGYITKELLGAGGYGEVWKAHAPGGLVKAIKFVYADLNSNRASREMRSLNRIKEVRHPFLLSIERIEVIDRNVVIVTELADESLKRHYQKVRANGQSGLPRDELLGYMRDAADALDYIYDNYSLQHLDIKPENLLLVGNRAKVADFGLIKNLYDRSASLIEGLTPVYAPPELFEGKPNRHSDQYSLAIVYQEMLTGELPFDGTTAARLAAQHLHTAPNLSALPRFDQPIIARALSKDPEQRYASCRALVEALADAGKGKQAARHETAESERRPVPVVDRETKTERIGDALAAEPSVETDSGPANEAAYALPIDLNETGPIEYAPVLFVGVGGVATRVLRRLNGRLHDRLGPTDAIGAVEMLLLDTDVKSLHKASDSDSGTALRATQTLDMPLRRTEEYRSAAGNILSSISRRWLYNLPYSLQTEGFRPLGRLALVDHSKRLAARLREIFARITSPENLEAAAQATGLNFTSRQPRVFIVASTSGGSGGGMVLDLAYAVRTALTALDLSDSNVHGVLLHCTPRGASDRDKAVANSYATLSELWHYSRPGHCYPGDRGMALPAFHGDNRTFSTCYFIHLGDDLTESQLDAATDPVAEYLYTSSVTPAVRFLDQCRHVEQAQAAQQPTEPTLRTFGLCQLGGSNSDIPAVAAELLCRELVTKWRSGSRMAVERATPRLTETMALIAAHDETKQSRFANLDEHATFQATQLELNVERMTAVAREMLDQEMSSDADSYFARLITQAFDAVEGDVERKDVSRVFAIIDSVLGGDEGGNPAMFDSLSTVVNTRLEGRAGRLATAVCDWIIELVDGPDGVEGAKHAAKWFQNLLRGLQATTTSAVGNLREQTIALEDTVLEQWEPARIAAAGKKPDAKALRETQTRMFEYARMRSELLIVSAVNRWLRSVEMRVAAKSDLLQEFWKDLSTLAGTFDVPPSLDETFDDCPAPEIVPEHWRALFDALLERRRELVMALDHDLEERLGVGPAKLRWYLTQNAAVYPQLATPLRVAARQLVLRAMQDLNTSRLSAQSTQPPEADRSEYARCIEAARPRLADGAMAMRLLLVVPRDLEETSLRKSLSGDQGTTATIVRSTSGGDFIACHEGESLDLRQVAGRLVDNRRDYVEIAKRLHTRIDVKWEDMSAPGPRCK